MKIRSFLFTLLTFFSIMSYSQNYSDFKDYSDSFVNTNKSYVYYHCWIKDLFNKSYNGDEYKIKVNNKIITVISDYGLTSKFIIKPNKEKIKFISNVGVVEKLMYVGKWEKSNRKFSVSADKSDDYLIVSFFESNTENVYELHEQYGIKLNK